MIELKGMERLYDALQHYTEKYLSYRKRKKAERIERQKHVNQIVDWIKSFLWAAMVVLIINQYLFQAYMIPSGSMMNTLLIKDRLFVNKFSYGPELIPGMCKLPGIKSPKRGDIIIFESPTYLSKGPLFDITQRILYMLTLSMVDIDKDSYGEPKAHFLIKRAVGSGGDRLRFRSGNMEIRPAGSPDWIKEADFRQQGCIPAAVRRLVSEADYQLIKQAGEAGALYDHGMEVSSSDRAAIKKLDSTYVDNLAFAEYRNRMSHVIDPSDTLSRVAWRKSLEGWYIPEGCIFPLGDNRDNSRDARYFGPVHKNKVLGQAFIIYWPFGRAGIVR